MQPKELHQWYIQNKQDVMMLGKHAGSEGSFPVGILQEDRRKSIWLLGAPETGKSMMLKYLALEDIEQDRNIIFLDVYGNILEALKAKLSKEVQNRIVTFNAGLARNVLDLPSVEEFTEVIRNGENLFIDLELSKIGQEKVFRYGQAILERIWTAVQNLFTSRRDVYVYVDELQYYQGNILPDILAQAPKAYLNLIMANQSTAQLDPAVTEALFKHAATKLFFTPAPEDVKLITDNLGRKSLEQDLLNSKVHQALASLPIGDRRIEVKVDCLH